MVLLSRISDGFYDDGYRAELKDSESAASVLVQGTLALSCRRCVYGNSTDDVKRFDIFFEGLLLLRCYVVVGIGDGQVVVYHLGVFEMERARLATITGAKMRLCKLEVDEDGNWRGWQECLVRSSSPLLNLAVFYLDGTVKSKNGGV